MLTSLETYFTTMPAEYSESQTDPSYRGIHIGSLHTGGNLFFAPMAGYTDKITRAIAYLCKADLCYTEMISCDGIIRRNPKTAEMLEPWRSFTDRSCTENEAILEFISSFEEKMPAVQLFTGSPDSAAGAARILKKRNPALIDLNCGCPMPKICRTGAGAALMEKPEKVTEIIRCIKEEAGCPVTVKIRSGIDENSISYPAVAEAALKGGADAITLHPRTVKQRYSGNIASEHIKDTVRISGGDIPVLGSGDLRTPSDAITMMRETGCTGVMFARGAVGNPLIFAETQSLLTDAPFRMPFTLLEIALLHLELSVHFYGSERGSVIMRKFMASYLKHIPGGTSRRKAIVTAGGYSEMRKILEELQ